MLVDALLKDKGMKLINERIEAWFNIHQKPDYDGGDFYAGSITSLLLDNKEFLDPVNAPIPDRYMFHDREKRCMQIDKVQLYDSKNNLKLGDSIDLFNQSYKYKNNVSNSNKISVTLQSCQLPYNNNIFRLERTISLHSNSDYIIDDIALVNENGSNENLPNFILSYYSHIHSKFAPLKLDIPSQLQNSFIMSNKDVYPVVSYGFISNIAIEKYPVEQSNSFLWELSPCQKIRSVHSFMRDSSTLVNMERISEKLFPQQELKTLSEGE